MKLTIYKDETIIDLIFRVSSVTDSKENKYIKYKYDYGNSTITSVLNYNEFDYAVITCNNGATHIIRSKEYDS